MRRIAQRPPLPGQGQMEDYTLAFLVSFGVLLWIGLVAIWGLFGFIIASATAYFFDRAIITFLRSP